MNSLEAEYSFLAPTWRLPSVATPSILPHTLGTSYLSSDPHAGPDWTLWNNTMYNSRYIPSYAPSTSIRRNYPIATNYQRVAPVVISQNYSSNLDRSQQSSRPPYVQPPNNGSSEDGLNLTISVHPNTEHDSHIDNSFYNNTSINHMVNRGSTYTAQTQNQHAPINQKRRVQIVDNNRQSSATAMLENMSERNSRNSTYGPNYVHYSRTPDSHKGTQKSKTPLSHQHIDHTSDNRHGNDGNNVSVHDYLYGLSAPDPGSYTSAYKQHQRRLQEEKLGRKSVVNEYRTFAKNYGFGPSFGNASSVANEEKLDTEKRRKTYSKAVHDTNQYKLEEQKRLQNINGQQKTQLTPKPKHQRFDSSIPRFSSTRKAREYAERIEKPHHMKPVVRLRDPTSGNVIIRDASNQNRQRITS